MANDNDHYTSPSGATSEQPGKVTVLPPEERENFKGITIDAGNTGNQEENHRGYSEYQYHDPYKRVFVRQVRVNNAILSWLFFGLLALVVVFLVLPFISFIFIPVIVPMFIIILLNKLLRRR